MKSQKTSNNPLVKVASKKANMKFRPKVILKPKKSSKLISNNNEQKKSQSILSWFKRPKKAQFDPNLSQETITNASELKTAFDFSMEKAAGSKPMKFLFPLSPEHYLIGNQYQLDGIEVRCSPIGKFIETEHLWSLNAKKSIDLVAVDEKKFNMLAFVAGETLHVYRYDCKKIHITPVQLSKIELDQKPKFLAITRDSTISVVFEKRIQIYTVAETVRKKRVKDFQFPEICGKTELMMVPKPFQSILNILFQEKKEDSSTFGLWCIEVEFLPADIKLSIAEKIYDIKDTFRSTLKIINYSRQIFLMNLGSQILALKRGYILDSATVNLKHKESELYYLGEEVLLHISSDKVQMYHFSIKTQSKPYRIVIYPIDSIALESTLPEEQFFDITEFSGNNFTVFFQHKREYNMLKKQEVQYSFYVTIPTLRSEKLNALFPKENFQELIKDSSLVERCDMAQKMGLTVKEIYLELWNKSEKTTDEDYWLLLSTKNYETIQNEISRKLKKASMSFKEVKKIEDDCFEMLENTLFSLQCSEEAVIQYICSHFFRRKLDLLKDHFLMGITKNSGQKLMITIQQYQAIKRLEIKSELMSLVSNVCEEEKDRGKNIIKIRLLIKNFKFVLRTIYQEVLEDIIKTAKHQLLIVLTEIPQLLPYEYEEMMQSPVPEFYDGVWSQINQRQWKQSLFADSITTIDNKEIVSQKIIKGLWFQRHWLSQHDMVVESRGKIKQNWAYIQSEHIFYFVVSKIFEHVNYAEARKQIIKFIETTYVKKFPEKLKGKIFLLHSIYVYLEKRNFLQQIEGRNCTFAEFLNFEYYQVFRHLFLKERSYKGLLLREIKPICENISEDGSKLFNQGLLEYFSHDISEVSDLKYILNRINNQRIQFHRRNQEMYEILVEALERKLKIGTNDDIPIDQVLIYIENIPLKVNTSSEEEEGRHCKALKELKSVEKINSEIKALQQARLNMSLYDILHNSEQVLTKLVIYQISANRIMEMEDQPFSTVQELTYNILATLENISDEIYEDPHAFNIFFIYLSKMCEKEGIIKHVKQLLKNEHFMDECFDETTAQNLVQYMYRWKLCSKKVIVQSQNYIRQLLTLIPQDSTIYQYINAELEFARLLSTPLLPIEFPISESAPTVWDVKDIIDRLMVEDVLPIDIEKLHYATATMQRIVNEEIQDSDEYNTKPIMTLHQAYEIIVIKLIKDKKLKEVLPLIRKLLSLNIPEKTYNIIYPILYIIEIAPELNEENKSNILEIVSYYFYDYEGLLNIVETLVTRPLTALQRKEYIYQKLKEGVEKYSGFNLRNHIFKADKVSLLQEHKGYETKFLKLLHKLTKHLQQAKEEFQKINYAAIMIMLHNQPYAIAKYINCKDALNLKFLRSFLSYVIKEDIFDPLSVLEFGRRIFLIILYVLREKIPIEMAISEYSLLPLDEEIEVKIDEEELQEDEFQYKIWKSAEGFKRKKKTVLAELKRFEELSESRREVKFNMKLEDIINQSPQKEPIEYPFTDSDDQDEGEFLDVRKTALNSKRFKNQQFQPIKQRQKLLKKEGHNNLFLSIGGGGMDFNKGTSHHFAASIRPKLKHLKTLCYEDYYDFVVKKPKKQNQQIFDDMELTESNNMQMELTPEKDEMQEKNLNSSPEIGIRKSQTIEEQELEESKGMRDRLGFTNSIHFSSNVSNPYVIEIKHATHQISEDEDDFQNSITIDINSPLNSPLMRSKKIQQQFKAKSIFLHQVKDDADEQLSIAKKFMKLNENKSDDFDYSDLLPISQNFDLMREFVKQIYTNPQFKQQMSRSQILHLLTILHKDFPILDLNSEILQIYAKAENLQSKFVLDLPFDQIFSAEGLFRNFADDEEVFHFIYPNIKKVLDGSNVHKITKMIFLIFKRPEFEPIIIFNFLCDQIFNTSEISNPIEVKMLVDRITALASKLDIEMLNEHFGQLYLNLCQSASKDKLLKGICDEVRGRKIQNGPKRQFIQKVVEEESSPLYTRMLKLL